VTVGTIQTAMAHFFQSGNTFHVAPADALNITETLPAGNYVVKFSENQGFYLEQGKEFTLPSKVYGRTNSHTERVLNSFRDRDRNTGVLLVGEKGSGKTLLARKISRDSGLPVLIINSSFTGDNFNSFLSSITQPCMVFFDEFEKIYEKDKQEKILTLLDGTYQSRKLFVITSNDKYRIDTHMRNRPGRIFYLIEFAGLDEEFIREYCQDVLKPEYQSSTDKIVEVSSLFDEFNFDMLVAIVEEINRYGEEPKQLLTLLNAKPEYSGDITYTVDLYVGDIKIIPNAMVRKEVSMNTTSDCFDIDVYFHWNNENPIKGEIQNEMAEYHGPADMEKIVSWIKSGDLMMGRPVEKSGFGYNTLEFEFSPDEITRYIGTRSIEYVNEDRAKVILTKNDKKSRTPAYAL
jgi:hypothetical protein